MKKKKKNSTVEAEESKIPPEDDIPDVPKVFVNEDEAEQLNSTAIAHEEFCRVCGTKLAGGESFCRVCGTKVYSKK